ncbi:MAG TPA: hypothetical protein VLJ21_05495 [Candidatus Binatia bacterium]|nr:hypothetical protein [Candidatus Binatia bacterium]
MIVRQLEEHAQGLPFTQALDPHIFKESLELAVQRMEDACYVLMQKEVTFVGKQGPHYLLIEAEKLLNESNSCRNEKSREISVAYAIIAAYHSDFLEKNQVEFLRGERDQMHQFRVERFDLNYFAGRNAFFTPFRHAQHLEPHFHQLADMHFSRARELREYIRTKYETAPFRNARLAEVGHYLGRLHHDKRFFEESLADMRTVGKYIRQWPRDLPKIVRAASTLCMELNIIGHEDYAAELSALTVPWTSATIS